ncbi:hypothetical protein EYS14_23170 [Alteromonadaceae bacterium M269]|nr:hypothetical protein EYS14_23170 [Alteromonadaceae bacterium M269]
MKIATVTQNPFDEVKVDSQFLNEPMLYESKNNFSPGSLYGTREFVVELVRRLHTRDIRMGHQAQEILAQYKAGVKAEARINYEAAKANSSNLYEQEGYAIDYKGERYDGKITVMFEELDVYDPDDPFSGPNIIDLSGDGEGAKIRIDYLNSKQKMKRKTLSAKKNNRFCVYVEEGQESCYQGLQIKSNGLLAAAGNDALEISVNQGNKFMREVSVNGTLSVYQEPASKAFFIKSSKQKKAFNFKFGPLVKEKRKASKLKDYLGGCDYSDGNYDENALRFDLNEVQALVDFYNQNCK